jgi:hypothetical protein
MKKIKLLRKIRKKMKIQQKNNRNKSLIIILKLIVKKKIKMITL